jgi:hypothetical protein
MGRGEVMADEISMGIRLRQAILSAAAKANSTHPSDTGMFAGDAPIKCKIRVYYRDKFNTVHIHEMEYEHAFDFDFASVCEAVVKRGIILTQQPPQGGMAFIAPGAIIRIEEVRD